MRDSARKSRLRRSGLRLVPLTLGVVLIGAPGAAADCVSSIPRGIRVGMPAPVRAPVPQCTRTVRGSALAARLRAGRPVLAQRVRVTGPFVLPRDVSAPVVLRDSCFVSRVDAAHASFSSLVDFTGSSFQRGADLSGARFEEAAVFSGAGGRGPVSFAFALFDAAAIFSGVRFEGPVRFEGADFRGESRFTRAGFGSLADFRLAGFARAADFAGVYFQGPATFASSELRSVSDFGSANFFGPARFDSARFTGAADFVGTHFAAPGAPASFDEARFDGGASFLQAGFDRGASFYLTRASGDLDFDSADVRGPLDFSTARLFGETSFPHARVFGPIGLDQAFVHSLDLRGATLRALHLPARGTTGEVRALRLDPGDARCAVDVGGARGHGEERRALALSEASAKADGDLHDANAARIRLLSLERDAKPLVPRIFDWLAWWGVLGFLVLPLHQLVLIGAVLVVGITVRWLKTRGTVEDDIGASLDALFRLTPPQGGGAKVEYLAYKILIVVLVVNVGNVWPPFRDLVQGVF